MYHNDLYGPQGIQTEGWIQRHVRQNRLQTSQVQPNNKNPCRSWSVARSTARTTNLPTRACAINVHYSPSAPVRHSRVPGLRALGDERKYRRFEGFWSLHLQDQRTRRVLDRPFFTLQHQNSIGISLLPHTCYVTRASHIHLFKLIMSGQEYKLPSPSAKQDFTFVCCI